MFLAQDDFVALFRGPKLSIHCLFGSQLGCCCSAFLCPRQLLRRVRARFVDLRFRLLLPTIGLGELLGLEASFLHVYIIDRHLPLQHVRLLLCLNPICWRRRRALCGSLCVRHPFFLCSAIEAGQVLRPLHAARWCRPHALVDVKQGDGARTRHGRRRSGRHRELGCFPAVFWPRKAAAGGTSEAIVPCCRRSDGLVAVDRLNHRLNERGVVVNHVSAVLLLTTFVKGLCII
mmetsp:Transcript_82813/g.182044  ORF Transcript_82813/g.182044 Transcript_82813/m.182044 type:complete len:232 (-) Transcript_82813:7-702(-)